MQKMDVPLAFLDDIFSKYINAGTNIIPPPVEKKPLINPALRPIKTFFIITSPTL